MKKDKLTIDWSVASGDIDWSECFINVERNKHTCWLAQLGSERRINYTQPEAHNWDDWLTYEDLARYAKLFCSANDMHSLLKKVAKFEFETADDVSDFRILQSKIVDMLEAIDNDEQ
jgi:hypothetical protein